MNRSAIFWLLAGLTTFALSACSVTATFDVTDAIGTDGTIQADVDSGVATAGRGGLSALGRGGLSMLGVNVGGGTIDYDAMDAAALAAAGLTPADLHDTFVDVGVRIWLAPYESAHLADPGLIRDPSNLLFAGTIEIDHVPGEDRWDLVPGRIAREHFDEEVFALLEEDEDRRVTMFVEFVCRDADGEALAGLDGSMVLEGLEIRVRGGL